MEDASNLPHVPPGGGRPLRVDVVIPALNEQDAIGRVLADIPAWVRQVIVVDNGSTDETAVRARAAGAVVLHEPERGYGAACLRGVAKALSGPEPADILVFLDGDHSDHADQMPSLIRPIARDEVDFVLGSRTLGRADAGALMPQQRWGNALATTLIRVLYGARYTDLGPFRAISRSGYEHLHMADRNYGWTVEMQVKAVRQGLRWKEVPVDYRVRIGTSKVSGTVRGTLGAGYKILRTIFAVHFSSLGASQK
ncbi:MAG: hypothetical protein RJA19_1844 [Bacteroidota bacterium]